MTQGDPDIDLVHRARGGDFAAFQDLVARHERRLSPRALRILRQPQDAEDAVQETFLSVLEHLRAFREESSFHTWVVRIATNHALGLLRKRRGTVTALRDDDGDDDRAPLPHPQFIAPWEDNPEEIVKRKEVSELLGKALETLSEKYLTAFLLRDVEGVSTEETARILGISEANVRVRLNRARLFLREELTRTLGVPERRAMPSHPHG